MPRDPESAAGGNFLGGVDFGTPNIYDSNQVNLTTHDHLAGGAPSALTAMVRLSELLSQSGGTT
jgi:hypothetical protein